MLVIFKERYLYIDVPEKKIILMNHKGIMGLELIILFTYAILLMFILIKSIFI